MEWRCLAEARSSLSPYFFVETRIFDIIFSETGHIVSIYRIICTAANVEGEK
jgi:hypothetical protein